MSLLPHPSHLPTTLLWAVGSFQLLHIVLVLTGASFAETSRQSYELQQQRVSGLIETPNVVQGMLAKKWRCVPG